jgi:hypothetical protein
MNSGCIKKWTVLGAMAASGAFAACGGEDPPSLAEEECTDFALSADTVVVDDEIVTVTLTNTNSLSGEPTLTLAGDAEIEVAATFTTDPASSGGDPTIRIACIGAPGNYIVGVTWGDCEKQVVVDCRHEPTLSEPASSVDLVGCNAGTSETGETWLNCGVFGDWPPSAETYSYFLTVLAQNINEEDLAKCTDERHDGVDAHYCDLGDPDSFTVVPSTSGFGVLFDASALIAPATLKITSGILPTTKGTFETESLTIPLAPGPLPPPWL